MIATEFHTTNDYVAWQAQTAMRQGLHIRHEGHAWRVVRITYPPPASRNPRFFIELERDE